MARTSESDPHHSAGLPAGSSAPERPRPVLARRMLSVPRQVALAAGASPSQPGGAAASSSQPRAAAMAKDEPKKEKKSKNKAASEETAAAPGPRAAVVASVAAFLEAGGFRRTLAALQSEADLEAGAWRSSSVNLEEAVAKFLDSSNPTPAAVTAESDEQDKTTDGFAEDKTNQDSNIKPSKRQKHSYEDGILEELRRRREEFDLWMQQIEAERRRLMEETERQMEETKRQREQQMAHMHSYLQSLAAQIGYTPPPPMLFAPPPPTISPNPPSATSAAASNDAPEDQEMSHWWFPPPQ